jgi:hypothetical protein
MLVAGLYSLASPGLSLVQAGYELPPGERITNLPAIPRNMPQKEAYENYDPVIGRNFDLKNFWLRADLRVRPELRNGVCFGAGNLAGAGGNCNTFGQASTVNTAKNPINNGGSGNTFFVQQWVRLGIGYDLSPDVSFYTEFIYSNDWGTSGNPANPSQGGGPALNNNCNTVNTGQCSLGIRAAYALIRNLGGVQGLSVKAGRQYIVFGNQSLFGHFDWANTGFSHDGIMFQYATKTFESYVGYFREADLNIGQAASTGAGIVGVPGNATGGGLANNAANLFIFYNQIKSVPGFLFEPHYFLFLNDLPRTAAGGTPSNGSATNAQLGNLVNVGDAAVHANGQLRHTIGNRTEMRKGNWDAINEIEYQFGRESSGYLGTTKDLHINAWATRNWLGYTVYEHKWKPRFAVGLDYASGDGNANCNTAAAGVAGTRNVRSCNGTANTFENFYPTNHIHMGYMDVMAWRNMLTPSANFQFRPTERDHFEFWYNEFYLANARDNWYRGSQGAYVFSNPNNTSRHIGGETDFTWTRMFADGKVALQGTWGHLFSGQYIKDNLGTSKDQDWAYLSLWMNF